MAHPLKAYLERHKLTQTDLATVLGVHQQHIHRIMAGKRWPSYKLAVRISQKTGISVLTLLGYNRS
jgi:transcriptional regulator with XRE-family HTH domain